MINDPGVTIGDGRVPGANLNTGAMPKTGDESNVALYIIMLTSGALLTVGSMISLTAGGIKAAGKQKSGDLAV